MWHIFRFAHVPYFVFTLSKYGLENQIEHEYKIFFCLECDIKSFPNTYIEMEQKRMELKNDNKNKNRILLGQ